jgi:hypothetical protein
VNRWHILADEDAFCVHPNGSFVRYADMARLLPRKGNDLPEDAGKCLVSFDGGELWEQLRRTSGGVWVLYARVPNFPIDLSRVTHWMPVPEVQP